MGLSVPAGETASIQIDVVATKAKHINRYDTVFCGAGIVRTAEEVYLVKAEDAGTVEDRVHIHWFNSMGYMNVSANEVFWVQAHGKF